MMVVVGECDPRIAKVGIIEGVEGIETVGALLGRPVSTQQLTAKVDANLWHDGLSLVVVCRRQFNACYELGSLLRMPLAGFSLSLFLSVLS